ARVARGHRHGRGGHEHEGEVMSQLSEQFLGAIDVRELHELHWPIMRLLARSFVERLELQRYKRHLLASGRWNRVRAVPHRDRSAAVSPYLFDLYGVPVPQAGAATPPELSGAFP